MRCLSLRHALFAIWVPVIFFIVGCSSTVSEPIARIAVSEVAPLEYRLGPTDKIRLIVFGEDGLSGEYEVDSGGKLSLPLIGEISASGRTPKELTDDITTAYAQGYVRNPKVSVEVLSYRPYYMLGEVKAPGEYPFRNGLNVLSAIAAAQGFTYRANTNTVYIDRPGQAGRVKYPASVNVPVRPGDVITVRERYF